MARKISKYRSKSIIANEIKEIDEEDQESSNDESTPKDKSSPKNEKIEDINILNNIDSNTQDKSFVVDTQDNVRQTESEKLLVSPMNE